MGMLTSLTSVVQSTVSGDGEAVFLFQTQITVVFCANAAKFYRGKMLKIRMMAPAGMSLACKWLIQSQPSRYPEN